MIIELYDYEQIQGEYAELYEDIFGTPFDPDRAPSLIYLGRRPVPADSAAGGRHQVMTPDFAKLLLSSAVGFLAGYRTDAYTFYIQRSGILKPLRKQKLAAGFFDDVVERLKSDGYRYLSAAIRNDNMPALIVALKSGFTVHGVRMDTRGVLYVEIICRL